MTCVQTLLDLGASPDYKDSRGLTPLYHSSMVGGDPYCCELLLHDHAQVGCMDENGWQEIHQVTLVLTCSCSQRLGNRMQRGRRCTSEVAFTQTVFRDGKNVFSQQLQLYALILRAGIIESGFYAALSRHWAALTRLCKDALSCKKRLIQKISWCIW